MSNTRIEVRTSVIQNTKESTHCSGFMTSDEFMQEISVSESKPELLLWVGQYVHFTRPRVPAGYIQCPVTLREGFFFLIHYLQIFFRFDGSDFFYLCHISFLYSLPCWSSPSFYMTSCVRTAVREGSPDVGWFHIVITSLP
jgi:hypothetical protein